MSLTHQKFRFFTFSREDARALDRICCSDNLDMLYLNYFDRSFFLFCSYSAAAFRHFFEVYRGIPLTRSFFIFGTARMTFGNHEKYRTFPIFPVLFQSLVTWPKFLFCAVLGVFLAKCIQPCDSNSKRRALKM